MLRSIETPQDFYAHPLSSDLAFVAVDFLIANFGGSAIVDFYESLQVHKGLNFRAAFEETFGISLEDFYAEFEAYMAGVATG